VWVNWSIKMRESVGERVFHSRKKFDTSETRENPGNISPSLSLILYLRYREVFHGFGAEIAKKLEVHVAQRSAQDRIFAQDRGLLHSLRQHLQSNNMRNKIL